MELYVRVPANSVLFRLEDVDADSDFYFELVRQLDDGRFEVKYTPSSGMHLRMAHAHLPLEDLTDALKNWFMYLHRYNEPTTFEDPVVKAYTDEFLFHFNITSENTDTDHYSIDQQEQLISYLTNVRILLAERKQDATSIQIDELNVIDEQCADLQKKIPYITKGQTLKKLARMWATSRKFGIPFLKDVLQEFKKEGIKAIVKEITSGLPSLIKLLDVFGS